jgi:hypothetical protein
VANRLESAGASVRHDGGEFASKPAKRLSKVSLSSDAKCNTPADLISARLFKTLGSVAMQSYSHLSEDESDQIGILRAAGQ